MCTLPGNNKSPCPPLARHTQISLKTDSNNNCNTSSYDDSSSVKANSNNSIQDKDFILELLCWHNEYRQVFNSPLPSDDDVNNDRPTPFSSRARHAVTALTVSSEVSTCRPLIYCCGMWTEVYVACGGILILSIFFNVQIQLCEYAQSWANHLAQSNEFYYRSDKTIGQNLFCCPVSALVTDLTGKWD